MKEATGVFFDDFIGHRKFAATSAGTGQPWCGAITGTTPTFVAVTSQGQGVVRLACTATSEAQICTLYFGDILAFKADVIKSVTFRVKMLADVAANETLTFGMTSARNDVSDSTTYNVQFKCVGSTAIVLETDDNATDNDDKASGITLSTTYKEFTIDFSAGLSDIHFYGSDAGGKLSRLAPKTVFSAPGLAGQYLQPNIMIQKASGTTTPSVDVDYVRVEYNRV